MGTVAWRSNTQIAEEARQQQAASLQSKRDQELRDPGLVAKLFAPADQAEEDEARAYIQALRGAPEQAATADAYAVGIAYSAGKLLRYEGGAYAVIIGHTSRVDWPPSSEGSLYRYLGAVDLLESAEALPWIQPTGSHDAYDTGDRVTHNGFTWESQIDANTTVPGSDDRWWTQV